MLTFYLIALVVGGTLILLSVFLGGDSELDADVDVDVDADVDVDHGFGFDGADLWLPFASVRFWIFFSTFFGLAGTLLSTVGGMSGTPLIAGSAVAVGYVCGVLASGAIKWLSTNEPDSAIRTGDMIGVKATILLPVASDRMGKVRFMVRGQVVDARATTVDDTEYEVGAKVMVYETKDDGEVVVTKADED